MDHLPTPSDGFIPAVKIPLICTTEYNLQPDGSAFIAFPKYCLAQIRQSSPDISPDEALASLIQSWLYFGTLSEFLRIPLKLKTFRKYDTRGSPILTTEQLDTLLRCWLDDKLRDPNHMVTRSKTLGTITIVARTLYCCEAFDKAGASSLLRSILFSVDILLETILAVCRGVTTYNDDDLSSVPSKWNQNLSVSRIQFRYRMLEGKSLFHHIFLGHMVSNGWCFHEVSRLLRSSGMLSMYYLACIRRTRRRDHSGCTKKGKCIAHEDMADPKKNISVHTQECGDGKFLELSDDDKALLRHCIQTGTIPLVRCTWLDSKPGDISIKMIKRAWYHSYCAISHVWIDGLASPSRNRVPRCQLEQLAHRVYQLDHRYDLRLWRSRLLYSLHRVISPMMPSRRKTVNLWLDGFCIPTWKEVLTIKTAKESIEMDIKDAAIAQMTPIYFQAQRTLVVDYEISGLSTGKRGFQQYVSCGDCKSNKLPCQECASGLCRLIMHIHCSTWMSRVWTRQEASLSGDLILNVPLLASIHTGSYGFLSIWDFENFTKAKMYSLWKSRIPRDRLIALVMDTFCYHEQSMIRKVGREGRTSGTYPGLSNMFGETLEQKLRAYDFLDTWNRLLHLTTTKIQDVASVMALSLNYGLSDIIGTKSRSANNPETEEFRERIARKRIANIISDQDAIPLKLLCFVGDQSHVAGDEVPSWIPPSPSKALLDRASSYESIVRNSSKGTTIELSQNATAVQIPCLELPCQSFRFELDGVSYEVTLQASLRSPLECQGLYVYLSFEYKERYNPLLWSTDRYGACFTIMETKPESLSVRFHSSLKFRACWAQSYVQEPELVSLPGKAVPSSVAVHLHDFWPTYDGPRPKPFRRPEALFLTMAIFGPNNTLRQMIQNCLGFCLPLCVAGLMVWLNIAARQPIILVLTVPVLYGLVDVVLEVICFHYLKKSFITSDLPRWFPYWYLEYDRRKRDLFARASQIHALCANRGSKLQSILRPAAEHAAADEPTTSGEKWVPRPMQGFSEDVDDLVYGILKQNAASTLHSVESMLWTTQDWSIPQPAAKQEDSSEQDEANVKSLLRGIVHGRINI